MQSGHARINDLVSRSLRRAEIPAITEPTDLSRIGGKRLDSLSLISWRAGNSVFWDVTVVKTVAKSYVELSSHIATAAAEAACLSSKLV